MFNVHPHSNYHHHHHQPSHPRAHHHQSSNQRYPSNPSSSDPNIMDEPRLHHHRSYDDQQHQPPPTQREPSIHSQPRRTEEFSSRSLRFNPYPPSAPRADHLARVPPSAPSAHLHHYHSNPSIYEDRLIPSRHHHHHHHDHVPQRTFDPNSQFNHGPPKDKSPPSQSVIFMGLPIHTDEANLRAFLDQAGASVESVTIIYDRITGQSKRYGFARFTSIDHARAFVEPAFPMLVWKEPPGSRFDRSGDGLKVKIDYSQKEKVPFEARHRDREPNSQSSQIRPSALGESSHPTHHSSSSYHHHHHHHSSSSSEPPLPPINDGARDIGGTPTSILLLRGLDPISTEQEIAQHLQHIPDPSQTVLPQSIRKVMLIKDRLTRASWGYAFVQFADVQVAVKALSLLLNTSLFPRGFQIRSRTITVTFAHEHSFHPVYTPSDWSFRGAGGQQLAYWDDKAYAAVYISNLPVREDNQDQKSNSGHDQHQTNHNPEETEMNELLSSIDRDHPTESKDGSHFDHHDPNSDHHHHNNSNLTKAADSEPHTSLHPESIQPSGSSKSNTNTHQAKSSPPHLTSNPQHETPPSNSGTENQTSKQNKNTQAPQVTSNVINQEHLQLKGTTEVKTEKKKNSAEPIATKKMVANIQKWNTKHQEISNPDQAQVTQNNPTHSQQSANSENSAANEDDFSDLNRMTCLLCQRQFKSLEDLNRHNGLSNLHKGNLQNDKLKRAARLRKAASLKGSTTSLNKKISNNGNPSNNNSNPNEAIQSTMATTTTKYTDRAAVRREVYGQPDAPDSDKHESKKARYEPAPVPAQAPAQPDKDGIQATNVGSKMLEKMGWQKGEGLGNGNGRVDPVMAAQYTKGVGLGASTGNLVGQYDDSKKGFMDQVKDKTVQRFNQQD